MTEKDLTAEVTRLLHALTEMADRVARQGAEIARLRDEVEALQRARTTDAISRGRLLP